MTKEKLRKLNGYVLRYEPDYPKSFTSGEAGRNGHEGYVYEHIYVMEKELGRVLVSDEEVHHLDFNRSNNTPSNLIVLSSSHHSRLHRYLESIGLQEESAEHKDRIYTYIPRCVVCLYPLQDKQKQTCSLICRSESSNLNKPDKITLEEELKYNSMVALSKKYGMSDNGLKKYAKRMGIQFPLKRN
jgi:hypothetical protein